MAGLLVVVPEFGASSWGMHFHPSTYPETPILAICVLRVEVPSWVPCGQTDRQTDRRTHMPPTLFPKIKENIRVRDQWEKGKVLPIGD